VATVLQRLATAAFRHKRAFLAGWLLIMFLVADLYAAFGSHINSDFTIPGSSSQNALNELQKTLPRAAGTSAQIVFESPAGTKITDPKYRGAVEASLTEAKTAPQVAAVIDPYASKAISLDGRTGLAQVQYTVTRPHLNSGSLPALVDATHPAERAGLTAHVGGSAYTTVSAKTGPSTALGILIAFAILAVTFGSLFAAGLPLLSALSGVAIGAIGVYLASNVATVSSTAPSLALMIGLAVGIDYSVFILSRYRSELAVGRSAPDAVGVAAATAGSAVVFAGTTVVIALAGLTVVGIPFLTVMGLSAAATVAIAVLVAITLLPAIIGFAGHRLTPKPNSRAARRERPGAGAVLGERWARARRAPPGTRYRCRRRGPSRTRRAGAPPATRTGRQQQRAARQHPTAGLRPCCGRVRPRLQRAADPAHSGPPGHGSEIRCDGRRSDDRQDAARRAHDGPAPARQ
jgi:putative drug exporter of the RND superfamily